MTPLTLAQVTAMLDLQDRLNALEDPQWEKKNHLRRAWIDTGNLVDAVEEGGFVNERFATVWQSMMSEWLKHIPKDETLADGAALFISSMYEERFWTPAQQATLAKHTDLPTLADAFVHMCSAGMFNAHLFERMMELWNMSWDDMYKRVVPAIAVDVFIGSLPDDSLGCESDWVWQWAFDRVEVILERQPDIEVVPLLNDLEQAYVAEQARRATLPSKD